LLFFPVSWPAETEQPPLESASVEEESNIPPALAAVEQTDPVIVPPDGERGCVSAQSASIASDIEEPPSVDVLGALTQPRSAMPSASPMWPQLLRIVWAVGALAWFVLALERVHHFRRLLRFARPAPAALQERARRLARSLGLRRCPRVRLLPGRIAPMLW